VILEPREFLVAVRGKRIQMGIHIRAVGLVFAGVHHHQVDWSLSRA